MIKFLGKNKIFCPTILHKVEKGQTLKDIAELYHISIEILKQNKVKDLYEGQMIAISGLNKNYHLVKPAETLDSIAKLYNTSKEKLIEKNNISKIFIGQLLEI